MIGLNKLGTALTVIIAVTLTALVLEIIYVLWRRQRFCEVNESDLTREASCFPSEELLYFLCWKKNKSRVEPREASLPNSASSCSPPELEEQVMKWQCLYGPSRMLFTIKEEEEREGLEMESEYSASASAEIEFDTVVKTNRACFSEPVGTVEQNLREGEVAVTIELNETTPFWTPCGSPSYYTPSSSPLHEIIPSDCQRHLAPVLESQDCMCFRSRLEAREK
ncbi:hypothetical protein L6164_009564 [Bauhinia variegata]|uniref:Uncharacterized protein n=1 Tax=Bauhinia variegata TaxID=167791 RepID=A0ACB9PK36_BAUVA|nr:hypothetical protein L6164_009564 [Bauhinia variegata]